MAELDGKKVEPFKKELFGSPESTTGLGSGFDIFSSPFSLGPALGSSKEASASPSKLSTSSHHGSPGPGSAHTSRTGSPLPQKTNLSTSSLSHGNIQDTPLANLDTIPLDSPEQSEGTLQSHSAFSSTVNLGEVQTSADMSKMMVVSSVRKDQQGWNDPPSSFTTPTRTSQVSTSQSTEDYQIQPLAPKQLETALGQGSQPQTAPPPGRDTAGTNPFRMGSGLASRKPAYGSSGIASFGSSPAVASASSVGTNVMIPSQPVSWGQGQPPQSVDLVGQGLSANVTTNLPVSMHSITTTNEPSGGSHTAMGVAGEGAMGYVPVRQHWFYLRPEETYWIPFSLMDSQALETAFLQAQDTSLQVLVATDGGRYDVDLHARKRSSMYWAEPESQVRRCSWFNKGEVERWYLPYDELTAFHLEEQYKSCCEQSTWNRSVPLGNGESVLLHSQGSMVHYPAPPPSHLTLDIEAHHAHPKAVMRGFSDLDKVEAGEEMKVDHLVFVVHGIGGHCDLSFRSLVDCVDDFREVSQLMLKTHDFPGRGGPGSEMGESSRGDTRGRVEYLPVHWHSRLHTTGVDEHLKMLTLPSISRLRDFTNSTLLDILYFTSPLFCQTIMSEVASEMNRMYDIFKRRNPLFSGGVSVVGHSLGSVILFDLLSHQPVPGGASPSASDPVSSEDVSVQQQSVSEDSQARPGDEGVEVEEVDGGVAIEAVLAQLGLENLTESFQKEQIDFESLLLCSDDDLRELSLGLGPRKKLSSYIKQQKEEQELVRQRRAEAREHAQKEEEKKKKEEEEREDTDGSTSMIFGAKIMYGLAGTGQTFVKYPTLLFTPQNLFALGSPIGLFLTVRGLEDLGPEFMLPTNSNVFNIYHPFDPVAYRIEPLVTSSAPEKGLLMPHHKGRKRFHLELYDNLGTMGASIKQHLVEGMRNMWQQLNEFARSHTSNTGFQSLEVEDNPVAPPSSDSVTDFTASTEYVQQERDWLGGAINQGRRVDHVLQEKPIEKLNEYLFALSSHLCYWRSEDTALLLLKEVYSNQGVPRSS